MTLQEGEGVGVRVGKGTRRGVNRPSWLSGTEWGLTQFEDNSERVRVGVDHGDSSVTATWMSWQSEITGKDDGLGGLCGGLVGLMMILNRVHSIQLAISA